MKNTIFSSWTWVNYQSGITEHAAFFFLLLKTERRDVLILACLFPRQSHLRFPTRPAHVTLVVHVTAGTPPFFGCLYCNTVVVCRIGRFYIYFYLCSNHHRQWGCGSVPQLIDVIEPQNLINSIPDGVSSKNVIVSSVDSKYPKPRLPLLLSSYDLYAACSYTG